MAAHVIGRVLVDWNPTARQWEIDPPYRTGWKELVQRAKSYAKDEPYQLCMTVSRVPHPRTLAQNRLMWELLTIMAREDNGGRLTGSPPEDYYLDMLEQHGCKFAYLECDPAVLDHLHEVFRIVKVIEILDSGKLSVKVSMGSSQFSTQEMHDFIEAIFDRLAEMGVHDPELTGYWRQWQGLDGGKETANG